MLVGAGDFRHPLEDLQCPVCKKRMVFGVQSESRGMGVYIDVYSYSCNPCLLSFTRSSLGDNYDEWKFHDEIKEILSKQGAS